MPEIKILDCTLRDGGYQNDCQFGFENQKKITAGLVEAGIDIIEMGFLTDVVSYDPEATRFTALEQAEMVIHGNRTGKLFVMLMDYGKYHTDRLPAYDGGAVAGLRVAFHKKDCVEALEECGRIKEKGYKVFVQAMVSLSYTDEEFLKLIERVNELEPYAFYIVDSFGMMKRKDLLRLFYLVEHNLKETICIGFHSHNNMQLAYSNAQSLVELNSRRKLIIDASVYGMGRGAGNLNTELFVEYLNENTGAGYEIKPLLNIIDEVLNHFYERKYWGYSLPNYISAKHNAHPSYAEYLDDKRTLTVEAMDEIFGMMDEEKKFSYDRQYIEAVYRSYMAQGKAHEEHREELKNSLTGKSVLLIAPGKSSAEEQEKIVAFAAGEDVIPISVNFDYPGVQTRYIFLSNLRRSRELEPSKRSKCIVTSNIPSDNVYLQTKYGDLLTGEEMVEDNAGLMAVNFLIRYGVKKIYLAGFDGYTHNEEDNYFDSRMVADRQGAVLDAMNEGLSKVLRRYGKQIEIEFLTEPKYAWLDKN